MEDVWHAAQGPRRRGSPQLGVLGFCSQALSTSVNLAPGKATVGWEHHKGLASGLAGCTQSPDWLLGVSYALSGFLLCRGLPAGGTVHELCTLVPKPGLTADFTAPRGSEDLCLSVVLNCPVVQQWLKSLSA